MNKTVFLTLALAAGLRWAAAQSATAFTFQGQLFNHGAPALDGAYDFQFTLYDSAIAGVALAPPWSNLNTPVTNGLFTVLLDYGTNPFTGQERWVETAVAVAGSGDYTTLSPRQLLAPTPYALLSAAANSLAGSLPAVQVSGSLSNAQLANSSVLINAGPGLSGGGSLALGGALTLSNAGVIAIAGNADIVANPTNGCVLLSTTATSTNAPGTIVKRNPDGSFAAGTITASLDGNASTATSAGTAANFSGRLWGDVTGTQGATVVGQVGGVSASKMAAGAAAANGAMSANTPGALVKRDDTGGFVAGVIAGTFVGDGSGLTNVAAVTGGGAVPSGMVTASPRAQDPVLVAGGYRPMAYLPAPAWMNGATNSAPSPRSAQAAVWTGQQLMIWGGRGMGNAFLASGALYDPAADAWAATSTVSAPSARADHTAVWTGSQMLIWGGRGAAGYLGSGGGLIPGGAIWSTTSTNGAPAGRSGQVAVWTGSQMLVWGGVNYNGLLNDGALYDPASNQWTPLLATNAPTPRFGAAAVWAGDRLIVWGGQGAAGELGDGAQLIFSNGVPAVWLTVSAINAPSPRTRFGAVWANDRLLLWGGQSGGLALGDGAAYLPALDQWQPLPATNAPAARYDCAGVWSGAEMLVLGGATAAGELNSGAAYDPLTQQWRSLTTLGGPVARSGPAAVWNGAEVLLFGGTAAGQPQAALQRLAPQPAWYLYRKL